jgi:NAD(P)H-hydrate epimerase
MTGAPILSGLGALKVGAGLLTIATPESARRIVAERLPEAMTIPLPETSQGLLKPSSLSFLQAYVRRRTVTTLAIGPGLGQHESLRLFVKKFIHRGLPVVVDADGLNNIRPGDLEGASAVITPHPGEMGRLLDQTTKKIQKDRKGVTTTTAKRLGIVCLLKGDHTVISDGRETAINPTGNSAMATGGMGDVLTGIIAGLLAQGLSLYNAACAGAYLHGLAGDLARVSDRGLLATELAAKIPDALKKIGVGR